MGRIRIGLAQLNTVVGDLRGNSARIVEYVERAKRQGVDLVAFPELAITGYPPEDLLLKPSFIEANLVALRDVARHVVGITAVVGFVDRDTDLYNAAAILHDGEMGGVYRKQRLPNYGVFDENALLPGRHGGAAVRLGGRLGRGARSARTSGTRRAGRRSGAGRRRVVVNIKPRRIIAGKWRRRATDACDPGAGLRPRGGLREPGWRPGRTGVRRQQRRLRRVGRAARGGAARSRGLLVCDIDVDDVFRARLHDPRRRNAAPAPRRGTRTAWLLSTRQPSLALPSAGRSRVAR